MADGAARHVAIFRTLSEEHRFWPFLVGERSSKDVDGRCRLFSSHLKHAVGLGRAVLGGSGAWVDYEGAPGVFGGVGCQAEGQVLDDPCSSRSQTTSDSGAAR